MEAITSNAVAALLGLADAHDLRQRANASCRRWLRASAAEGDLGVLSSADIQVVFERCSLVFDHGILGYPVLETRLGLYVVDPSGLYFRGLRPVGHYRLITLLDGTADDDYFVLENLKQAEPCEVADGRA